MTAKTGILLINLGTPDSPSTGEVRKYLHQFFSDPRVIDIPWLSRQLLKYFIILPFRSPKSAQLYSEIWTEKGSPLLIYSEELKAKLQHALGDGYAVELGMGYGNPSIGNALKKFEKANLKKLIVLPLFPQYASSTTGSVTEAAMKIIQKWEVIPETEFIQAFYNDVGFIDAWVERAKAYDFSKYDHILFSYHGLPERHILKADYNNYCLKEGCCATICDKNLHCYRAQCYATTRLMNEKLNIPGEDFTVTFQSRLGKSPWIKPYTDEALINLAQKGKKKVLVFAPAFVADCLETVHEIGIEYDELFEENGGEKVTLVESLNSHDRWVDSLKKIISNK